ncbi:tyrosine-type recombinase/integrase [Nitrososphaera sp. AFS]|uniref:tyrosine-type recombinase/integrase n=1 Tax=Nitrososphaera sp. AFS TaxID=2301191 RepID=UPI0013922253|nr:tyrosine-type recombinase/integrase [Nitrososphaera sp. AFS]NAL77280.1 hypothetical protein [Nitrososphaera sp. AFS]
MSKKDEFCRLIAVQSKNTAAEYNARLRHFEAFLAKKYGIKDLDIFLDSLRKKAVDVYDVMGEYHIDMKQRQNYSNSSIVGKLTIAKNFLEFNEIQISKTIFKLRVRTPRQLRVEIEALSKDMIRKIIIACNNDKRLQTYILLLAATGMRAREALSVRLKDIDWSNHKVILRAQYTKTNRPRYVYLTKECVEHLKNWKEYRERVRRIVTRDGKRKIVTRPFRPDDLFFSTGRREISNTPYNLYVILNHNFVELCDKNGFEARNEDNKRRKFTFHSFRRFVKSTISDLGHQDYSEWFLGHSGSTYYRKTEAEKLEIFHKVEPYLTYLDYSELEAKGADTETKLAQSKEEIEELKRQISQLKNGQDQRIIDITRGISREMQEEVERYNSEFLADTILSIVNKQTDKPKTTDEAESERAGLIKMLLDSMRRSRQKVV